MCEGQRFFFSFLILFNTILIGVWNKFSKFIGKLVSFENISWDIYKLMNNSYYFLVCMHVSFKFK